MKCLLKFAFALLFPLSLASQTPGATITASGNTVCTNSSITFSATVSNGPASILWRCSPSTSLTFFPDNSGPVTTITFGRAGIHTVSLTVSNSSGSSTAVMNVTVIQSANASFNASLTSAGFPNDLVLTNYSTNALKNYWIYSHIPGLAGKDSSLHSTMNYTASGSYSVMLVALGAAGCNDTLSYKFRISDSSGITAPTIFTPNNDNVNDVFKPITRGIKAMNVWVYSRYGTLIANWDKVNGFWDGYTTSGLPCQTGVYFYIIEATGFDGKSYKIKNNLTLIR